MLIRGPEPADEMPWRQLWSQYNAFYQAVIPEHVTAQTWQRILDPALPIFARLAEGEGVVAGFSISVLHPTTWAVAPACYLEDLFVAPEFRGRGFGRRLVADVLQRAKANGWSRLYWHTRASNPARKLYDEFTTADDFVRYRVVLRDGE
jgi:GNAT superfamily N-acetyltransferase